MSVSTPSEPTLTRELARMIRGRRVESEDLANAERYVRDWLGCMVAGRQTAPGRALRAYAGEAVDPRAASSRAANPTAAAPETSAFLAAALSHITETDDLHRASVTHPGCVVIPTCLVLGRAREVDGTAVLRGVLAGYEAMLRVGEALGPGHYQRFHNTATAGVFGSAAAAATILDLDEDGWVWALGNAGTQAAGLWQFNEDATMSKHLHAGHAAVAGLRAALLADQGFTGPAAILEGEKGFFRALCPDPAPEAVLRPTAAWKLPETSLKPYPCCRHTHPAIDAALSLREQIAGDGRSREAVRSVLVSTYGAARNLTDNPSPSVPYAAKFSIQFCVATALVRGTPDLGAFDVAPLDGGEVRLLMERTSVEVAPTLEAAYPDRWGARVRLEWDDGHVSEEARPTALGDPESPMSDAAIDEKFRSLCRFAGVSDSEASTLMEGCRRLVDGAEVFAIP